MCGSLVRVDESERTDCVLNKTKAITQQQPRMILPDVLAEREL